MKIGEIIRQKRKQMGISQDKLSELTGIPQTTISGWERGFEPKLSELKNIAIALNCSCNDFLDDSSSTA